MPPGEPARLNHRMQVLTSFSVGSLFCGCRSVHTTDFLYLRREARRGRGAGAESRRRWGGGRAWCGSEGR